MSTQAAERIDFGNVGWRIGDVPITFGSKANAERWALDNPESLSIDPEDRIPVHVDTRPTVRQVRTMVATMENEAAGVATDSAAFGTVGPWDEYFTVQASFDASRSNEKWPEGRWIAVYVVPGSSEGLYLHVDAIDCEGKRTLLLLGKTCSSGRETWAKCYESAGRISYLLNHS